MKQLHRFMGYLVICTAIFGAPPALAHKGSDAYLEVQQQDHASPAYRFNLSVALKDLDLVVPVDADADARVTWSEVKAVAPQVLSLLDQTVTLDSPACPLQWQADGLERRSDGMYFRALAFSSCTTDPANNTLALHYTLFKAQDASHRLLVAGRVGGQDLLTAMTPQQAASLLLSADGGKTKLTLDSASGGAWAALRQYFLMGMHHLLEGYDHLAFLLALVLPLRLQLHKVVRVVPMGEALHASPHALSVGAAWWSLLRTVTAFTIGHSVTLILAALGWLQASPALVEPVIAVSIAVTALLNLRPIKWLRADFLALMFGLVHGFGFAGLLQEAGAPAGLLPWALLGFNLGVEGGQLLAVCGWVAVSQTVMGKFWYHRVVVQGGSVTLFLLAAWWFWERVG